MSAERTASYLLFALVSTIVLFAVFAGVSRLPFLAKHAYATDYGWQTAASAQPVGVCDRSVAPKGFPITERRPSQADPTGCADETNAMAGYMNLALYFAAAAMISVGAVGIMRR